MEEELEQPPRAEIRGNGIPHTIPGIGTASVSYPFNHLPRLPPIRVGCRDIALVEHPQNR